MSDLVVLDPRCINHVQVEPTSTRTYCSRCKGWQVVWVLDKTNGSEVEAADTPRLRRRGSDHEKAPRAAATPTHAPPHSEAPVSRAPFGRCSCGVNRRPDGCPHGCDVHRAPHRRAREAEARTQRLQRAALRHDDLLGVGEVTLAAERVAPGISTSASWRARRFRF